MNQNCSFSPSLPVLQARRPECGEVHSKGALFYVYLHTVPLTIFPFHCDASEVV